MHKRHEDKELIEKRRCELLYLPLSSPDLDSIEEAISKRKEILRKTEARTREAFVGAMDRTVLAETAQDA